MVGGTESMTLILETVAVHFNLVITITCFERDRNLFLTLT